MTRVCVAGASAVVRAGLEAVVRANNAFDFVGTFPTPEFETRCDEIAADVVLLDLPQLDEDWAALLSTCPVPVVLLTPSADATALRAGVRGILPPDATSAEISAAITSAALGLLTVQPSAIEGLFSEIRVPSAALEEPLSPREREVLTLLAEGLSNKVIAYRLNISEHTVKFHVTSIMGKLRAASRTDAVMQGIRRGLILL